MSKMNDLKTLENFVAMLSGQTKFAEANTEVESNGGKTEHPIKDKEDNTEDSEEGSRSQEHEEDLKKQVGEASTAGVAEKAAKILKFSGDKPMEGTASSDHVQIGTRKEPTGEDPNYTTEVSEEVYEDPGTSHPAATDNDSLDGLKYAALRNIEQLPTNELEKLASYFGDKLLAAVVGNERKSGHNSNLVKAAAAGAAAADKIAEDLTPEEHQAIDELVIQKVAEALDLGEQHANGVASFLAHLYSQHEKQAMGGMPPEAMGGMPPEAMGGMPPEAMGGMPPEAMGGMPPEAMGGMPPEAMGAAGGQLPPEAQAIMELVQQISQSMGISEEEALQLLLQEISAGGQEGMPPEAMGGMPPEAMGGMPPEAMGGMPPEAMGGMPPGGGMEVAANDWRSRSVSDTLAQTQQILREHFSRS